jgi:hypothetical protein
VVDTEMSNFTKTDTGRELTLGMQALKRSYETVSGRPSAAA